jgi:Uma2 family endonuclease
MGFDLTINDIPHYTYKDYELWEGDWEIIRGIPYAMSPAPNWKHQNFGGSFVHKLRSALETNNTKCNCIVLYECDWIISDDTVVRPDVMVTCEPIEGNYPTKPPVLILEILSSSSILKDRNTKFNLYQAYGVKYYLIADIERKEIEFFVLKENRYQQETNLQKYHLSNDCAVSLDILSIM